MTSPIAELPVTGYLDRLSRRPGERFRAMVSARDGGPVRARLLRVISGDPNPDGPGLRFEDLSHRFDITFDGERQAIHAGSHAVVPRAPHRAEGPCSWSALIWFAASPGAATIMAEHEAGAAISLALDADGVVATVTGAGGAVRLATGGAPAPRRWHRLWLSADPASGRVVVGMQPFEGGAATKAAGIVAGLRLPTGGGASRSPPMARHRPARTSPARSKHRRCTPPSMRPGRSQTCRLMRATRRWSPDGTSPATSRRSASSTSGRRAATATW